MPSLPRELSLVLHGVRGTSIALPLTSATAVGAALALSPDGGRPAGEAPVAGAAGLLSMTLARGGGATGVFRGTGTGATAASGGGGRGGAAAAAAMRPFTSPTQPDVFVVQWQGPPLGALIRADLMLTQVRALGALGRGTWPPSKDRPPAEDSQSRPWVR